MLAVLSMLLVQNPVAPDLVALAARTRPAVVKLLVLDDRGKELGSGTGFFVSAGGRIVTNHHVVSEAVQMVALMEGARRVPVAGLLAEDEPSDLAVVQAVEGAYPSLSLGDPRALKVGDPVAVIGSPIGLEGSLSNGIVSAIRNPGTEVDGDPLGMAWQIQITAPISPGSSGSPVLAADGRVVGVAVGEIRGGQGLNFAIPADLAAKLVAGIRPGARPGPFQKPMWLRNLAVSAGVLLLLALLSRLAGPSPRKRRGEFGS